MDLKDIRSEIDEIDRELLPLFIKRMNAARKVAESKKGSGMKILNAEREQEILTKAAQSVPAEYSDFAVALYQYIFELSRSKQWETLYEGFPFSRRMAELEKSFDGEKKRPTVCVQGVEGAYSHIAAGRMYPEGRMIYVSRWEDVLNALDTGDSDYGVLPVENSSAGSVVDVYDLLLRHEYYIVREQTLKIDHCLLGVKGSSLEGIREVYSHPHALPQCSEFLHAHSFMKPTPYPNTAMAAEKVAKDGDPKKAAIASKECAELFGLDILCESVQQSEKNSTRFISVARRPEFPANANKISLAFTVPHTTGSLFRALARFSLYGLNLTKIESRPEPDKPFEYTFYLDFTGSVKSPSILSLLSSLNEELPSFHYLGNYNDGTSDI